MNIKTRLVPSSADINRRLRQLAIVAPKAARDELNTAAIEISNDAKQAAPVKTGRLRASIRPFLTQGTNWAAGVEVGAHYASYVEFGTVKMAPRPYLMPAYRLGRRKLAQKLRTRLRQEIVGLTLRRGR